MEKVFSVNKIANTIGEWILDLIFPRFCIGCHKEGNFLCSKCKNKIIKIKTVTCIKCQKLTKEGICPKCKKDIPITKAIILGYYRDPILRELIHNFKYEGLMGICDPLSELLIERLKTYRLPNDCTILPIPLNKWRLASRGFNQSELIAKKIAQYYDLNFNKNILKRKKNTKPQIGLSPQARLENTRKAFCLEKNAHVPGTVILVDDVVTTGATINECAKVLRQAGAKRIWVIALAHG